MHKEKQKKSLKCHHWEESSTLLKKRVGMVISFTKMKLFEGSSEKKKKNHSISGESVPCWGEKLLKKRQGRSNARRRGKRLKHRGRR